MRGLGLVSLFMSLMMLAVVAFAVVRYGPAVVCLERWRLQIQKNLPVTVDSAFPAVASFDHSFPVPLKTDIPVRFPVSAVVNIPIQEIFQIPLSESFPVTLNKPLRINDSIQIKADLPLDAMVETKVLGVPMTVPIKGVIPLDLTVPLAQDITIDGEILVHLQRPLPVSIDQQVLAPLDFMVEGVMPLDTHIMAPIQADLHCGIDVQKALSVDMDLDLSMLDVLSGLHFKGP